LEIFSAAVKTLVITTLCFLGFVDPCFRLSNYRSNGKIISEWRTQIYVGVIGLHISRHQRVFLDKMRKLTQLVSDDSRCTGISNKNQEQGEISLILNPFLSWLDNPSEPRLPHF
jgi:hypothetical protein